MQSSSVRAFVRRSGEPACAACCKPESCAARVCRGGSQAGREPYAEMRARRRARACRRRQHDILSGVRAVAAKAAAAVPKRASRTGARWRRAVLGTGRKSSSTLRSPEPRSRLRRRKIPHGPACKPRARASPHRRSLFGSDVRGFLRSATAIVVCRRRRHCGGHRLGRVVSRQRSSRAGKAP